MKFQIYDATMTRVASLENVSFEFPKELGINWRTATEDGNRHEISDL